MHSRTCMVQLDNFHGSAQRLPWLDFATSMVQLSEMHGSAFAHPFIVMKQPFQPPGTPRRECVGSIPNEVQIKFKSGKYFSRIRADEISSDLNFGRYAAIHLRQRSTTIELYSRLRKSNLLRSQCGHDLTTQQSIISPYHKDPSRPPPMETRQPHRQASVQRDVL